MLYIVFVFFTWMLLFRCKMRQVMHYLFVSCIFSVVFLLHLFLFCIRKIIKNGYIVIFNIIINIKKGSGGNDAVLVVILLWNLQKASTWVFSEVTLLTSSTSNVCSSVIFFVRFQQIIYNFEGLLMEGVKIKITCIWKCARFDSFSKHRSQMRSAELKRVFDPLK